MWILGIVRSKGRLELNQGENLVGLAERKHSRQSQSPPGWYPQFGPS